MDSSFFTAALLGCLFVPAGIKLAYSAHRKLSQDLRIFEEAMANYQLLDGNLISLVSKAVIAMEIATAIAILLPFGHPLISGALLAVTGALFAGAQVSVLVRRLKVSCGCHGSDSKQVSKITLLEPLWLLLSGVLLPH